MEYSIEEMLDVETIGPEPLWLKQRKRELAALRAIADAARTLMGDVDSSARQLALADALDVLDKEKGE